MWARWHRQFELALLVMVLLVLGTVHFSRLTPEERRLIELEAGLEQLYLLESAHFAQNGRYFDPTDPREGLDWAWLDGYEWEARVGAEGFAFLVETLCEAAQAGCSIGEVPVLFVGRRHGASKLTARVFRESLIVPWRVLMRFRRRPPQSPR